MLRSSRLRFALVALLGGAAAASSQPIPDSTLSPSTGVAPVAEEITVTATATPERVDAVPSSVEVIGAERLAERRADQAIDVLRDLAGLDVVQSGARGKAASVFTRGTNSSHTLVLWNGVELNDPYLGAYDFSTLALDGVERVEVVRGPYSALYGSNAVGGVVQLVTHRTSTSGLAARIAGGSNELLRAGGTAGRFFGAGDGGSGVGVDLSGHLRHGEGEVDNDFFDGDELDLALDGRFGGAFRLGLLLRDVGSTIGVPFDYAGTPAPHREQELDALSIAVPFGWTGSRVDVEAALSRTDSDLAFRDPDDPFAASDTDALREQARASVRFHAGERLLVTVGGETERQEATTASAFGPGLDGNEAKEWAAYAQASWSDGPVRVDAGLRRDDNDAFGGETSARLAAAWSPRPGLRLRGGYGEAFRAPSLADLYYPGFGNPELLPERSKSGELAFDFEAGAFRGTVALFENDLDNLIEFDARTFLPQNLGRARIRGFEGMLGARFGRFEARLQATLQDAENRDTGEALLRRPEEKASLALAFRPGAWTAGLVARHVGDRVDFGDVPLPAYDTLDLTLARAFGSGGRFEPFLRVENLFDASYEEVAGYPAPGTAFTVGVDARF